MIRILAFLAALIAFLAIAFGAVGAHFVTDPQAKAWLDTGSRFALPHAVAIFALLAWRKSPPVVAGGWLLAVGSLAFSGSLYLLAFGFNAAGLAPVGGTIMMLGWLWIALQALIGRENPIR